MNIAVFGASGATGRHVVSELADRGVHVRIVIRERSQIPDTFENHENIEIIKGNVDEFSIDEMKQLLHECTAAVSCLGHNLSLKGIFGPPHRLVTNLVRKVRETAAEQGYPKRFILMSTTAYTNRAIGEKNPFVTALVLTLLSGLLPPHRDNMLAGDSFIRNQGSPSPLEWVLVRPDSLIDEDSVSGYEIFERRQRDPLSDPGKTSRVNAAHFMCELLLTESLWQRWSGKTPVIYNTATDADR